jgi:Trk-type K+ transport system membrane component
MIYISMLVLFSIIIMKLESVDMERALFEASAALSTTGISMGITPSICSATKILLALLMFIGRVGGFSFVLIFAEGKKTPEIQRPTEKILVG